MYVYAVSAYLLFFLFRLSNARGKIVFEPRPELTEVLDEIRMEKT